MSKKLKVLMSGGGTGGHIFPAVAIAQEIQKRFRRKCDRTLLLYPLRSDSLSDRPR